MKIYIVASEDPLLTIPFLKKVIIERKDDIIGFALVKGVGRLTIGKKKSKIKYLLSLFLILGPFTFSKNIIKTNWYRVRTIISNHIKFVNSGNILDFLNSMRIPTQIINNPNSKSFIKELSIIEPDVIIYQSQNILKEQFLSIPIIGTINRHNALLPKNRGRLTPFWVKYKRETETGVSIHFVEKEIDSGDIIVQKKFEVKPHFSVNRIVKTNYELAPIAMLEALEKLELGNVDFIQNDNYKASYNGVPTLYDAIRFRLGFAYHSK